MTERGGHAGTFAQPWQCPRLRLLGEWRLTWGGMEQSVRPNERRIIALLALHGPQSRSAISGTLWPERSEEGARRSLRSAVWRLKRTVPAALVSSRHELALHPSIGVDAGELREVAHQVLDHPETVPPRRVAREFARAGQLLPGWDDEWVLVERERLNQLRLHALEALARHLIGQRRFGEALDAALAATVAEPLRDSSHVLAIRIHLAEGNPREALRRYERYRELLRTELGVLPEAETHRQIVAEIGEGLTRLLEDLRSACGGLDTPADSGSRVGG